MDSMTLNTRLAGLSQFTNAQKEESLRRLREAANRLFGESGYFAISIDDIAKEAGVTRKTFYRHFAGKREIAMDLFERQKEISAEIWAGIGDSDPTDPSAVSAWLDRLLAYYAGTTISRTIVELGFSEPDVMTRIKDIVPDLIATLGERVPAFANPGSGPAAQRRQAEAWLLIYQIMDQSMLQATGLSDIERPMLIELLTEKFLGFMTEGANPKTGL